jgi:hypothetical protein
MRNRYYSVETGRFLSGDPIGVWGDRINIGNQYGYVGERGLVLRDPLGLQGVVQGPLTLMQWQRREAIRDAINGLANPGENPTQTIARLGRTSFGPAGHRYLSCGDGAVLDMRHFIAAAAQAISYGEACSNMLGWFQEVAQWLGREESGAPMGGNEDLGSNAGGADFGDEHLNESGDLGTQILDYIDVNYGGLDGSSASKSQTGPSPTGAGSAMNSATNSASSSSSNSSSSNSSSNSNSS